MRTPEEWGKWVTDSFGNETGPSDDHNRVECTVNGLRRKVADAVRRAIGGALGRLPCDCYRAGGPWEIGGKTIHNERCPRAIEEEVLCEHSPSS